MLSLLQTRVASLTPSALTRLRTHHTSALTFAPAQSCDLIVTHFFLDCLTQSELDALTQRLAHHASGNTLWLVSDFRIPDSPMRLPARILVRLLYLAFHTLTGLDTHALPNHEAALTAAGFKRHAHHLSLAGLLTTELWAFTPAPTPLPYNIHSL